MTELRVWVPEDVKGEDKTEAEEDSSPSSSPSSRYSCRWCRKGFTYKCRKAAHEKRCPLSQQSELQCPDCPQKLANQRALQRHRLEAHRANTPSKKKVACDLCGRTFAHPSGGGVGSGWTRDIKRSLRVCV